MVSSYQGLYLSWQMLCYNLMANIQKAFFVSPEMQKKWLTWYGNKKKSVMTRSADMDWNFNSAFALRMATTMHVVSRIPMFPHHYSSIGYETLKSLWLLKSTMTNASSVPRILKKRLLSSMHYLKWIDVLSCTWLPLCRLVFGWWNPMIRYCSIHMDKWLMIWYYIGL